MGRIKNLLIEADDLGIVTTGRSLTEIAEDIENYHHNKGQPPCSFSLRAVFLMLIKCHLEIAVLCLSFSVVVLSIGVAVNYILK